MSDLFSTDRTTWRNLHRCGFLVVLMLGFGIDDAAVAGMPGPHGSAPTQSRRPVALAFDQAGTRLFVANRNTGTISAIDAQSRSVIAESKVASAWPTSSPCPPERNGSLSIKRTMRSFSFKNAIATATSRSWRGRSVRPDPVKLALSPDGSTYAVASRWGRCVTLLSRNRNADFGSRPIGRPSVQPARHALRAGWLDTDRGGCFGGQVAAIDMQRFSGPSRFETLAAHNIRGLAADPGRRNLVACPPGAQPERRARSMTTSSGEACSPTRSGHSGSTIFWRGNLRTKPLLVADSTELIDLGRVSGDPSAISCDGDGRVILTLAGVDQLVFGVDYAHPEIRVSTGRVPTAFAVDSTGKQVFVVETLDDTVSVYEVPTGRRLARIPLGDSVEPSLEDRGEHSSMTPDSHEGTG